MSKISQQLSVTVVKSRPVETVTPPPGFCYVEESIARCTKLTRQNLFFLRSYSFCAFVNVSGQELNSFVQKYANESAITVHSVFTGGQSPLTRNVSLFEEFIKSALELVLDLSVNSPAVLVIGSPSHCLDSILVACLRKVQEWSFVSILGELRMHSGCRLFDVEQFIEYFDPDIIDISKNTPDFLKIHIRLKDEEEKLMHRLEQRIKIQTQNPEDTSPTQQRVGGSDVDADAIDSDFILGKLFFSSKLSALSPGIQFDSSISLINDKDDDD